MGVPAEKIQFGKPEFIKISDVIWDVPASFKQGMRVPARIIATRKLIDAMDLQVYDQITNVATLPGIQKYAFCMPDGHSGYGFPIGGVAAFDVKEGGGDLAGRDRVRHQLRHAACSHEPHAG